MAASDIKLSLNLNGNGLLTGPVVGTFTPPTSPLNIGTPAWPAMALALTYGAGNNQIKNWYRDSRVLATATNDDLDLSGALVNELGDTLLFTAVKVLLLAIDSPDGTKKLKIGPGAAGVKVANAFVGPWVNSDDSCSAVDNFDMPINMPWAGYVVTPGTGDKLRVRNDSGVSVTYRILIGGLV